MIDRDGMPVTEVLHLVGRRLSKRHERSDCTSGRKEHLRSAIATMGRGSIQTIKPTTCRSASVAFTTPMRRSARAPLRNPSVGVSESLYGTTATRQCRSWLAEQVERPLAPRVSDGERKPRPHLPSPDSRSLGSRERKPDIFTSARRGRCLHEAAGLHAGVG